MPKNKYVHLAILVDRSGSMNNIAADMEGGLKSMIESQKSQEGKLTLSLARFDDTYDLVYDFKDIADCSDFKLQPRGWTALYDSAALLINNVTNKIQSLSEEEKPEKVLFVIITDGEDNKSTNNNSQTIQELILKLRNIDSKNESVPDQFGTIWDFVFLGANFDTAVAGNSMAINQNSSMNYDANSAAVYNTLSSFTSKLTSYRSDYNATMEFNNAERAMASPQTFKSQQTINIPNDWEQVLGTLNFANETNITEDNITN